jgi:hypothetical protein
MNESQPFDFRYSVQRIRAGQPRPYADSEYEYLVKVEHFQRYGKDPEERNKWVPWLPIASNTPTEAEQKQLDHIVKGVCQNFYRTMSEPGSDWASPILQWMRVDKMNGTIHLLIKEAYTD